MKFLLPLRRGLAGAWKQPKLVLLVYLFGLLPALLVALLAYGDLAPLLNDSAFAASAFEGERMAVWNDYQRADGSDFGLVTRAAWILAFGLLVVQILIAAGTVETLLTRESRREHPFLLGIGRHSWRFVRSAVWFIILSIPVLLAVGVAFTGVNEVAEAQMDGRVHLIGWGIVLFVALLIYMVLDLAYDLSRVAAATHDEGRTFVGYFRALFHTLRHPILLAPFWLFFTLLGLGLHLGYVAGRAAVQPENLGQVALVLLVQQAVFLLAAYLRVSLWAGEVAYYQAAGEPRWCGRPRPKPARDATSGTAPVPEQDSPTIDPSLATGSASIGGASVGGASSSEPTPSRSDRTATDTWSSVDTTGPAREASTDAQEAPVSHGGWEDVRRHDATAIQGAPAGEEPVAEDSEPPATYDEWKALSRRDDAPTDSTEPDPPTPNDPKPDAPGSDDSSSDP